MLFTFTKTPDTNNHFDSSTIEMNVEATGLDDLLSEFANFLRACGYVIPQVDNPIIINDEE